MGIPGTFELGTAYVVTPIRATFALMKGPDDH